MRDRRPFQVVSRATFDDPGDALRRLFAASGLIGEVDVARNARGGAVAIRIDVEATEAAEASEQAGHDAERPTDSLLLGDDLLVMVAGGSFVASVGFTVDDDQARLDEDSIERALERDPATLRLYLEWQHHE